MFTKFVRAAVRVLVPGAGLGRLAFDIAKSGTKKKKFCGGFAYSVINIS